jgi:Replication-relaxation
MSRPAQKLVQLTLHDIEMMLTVYRLGGCATSHLLERHWPPVTKKFGARNSCYRRVQQLGEAGYLEAVRLPSLSGLGAGRSFLTLGSLGRRAVAEHLGLSRSELHHLRHIETPIIGAHHLRICDFRVSLELACDAQPGVELAEWTSERELRARPIVRIKDPRPENRSAPALIPLIADGEFRLNFADATHIDLRFEMDMATIPVKRMRPRLRAYLAHTAADERPVLWVVPDERRLKSVAQWAAEEADSLRADPTIFWLGLQDHARRSTILGPIWQVVSGPVMSLVPSDLLTGVSAHGG